MDDRIQRKLDGELRRDQLNVDEVTKLDEAEALFAAVVRAVPVRPLPDLGPAVLRRLEAFQPVASAGRIETAARSPMRTAIDWLWTPRPISLRFRPAYAFGIAAAFALLVGARAAVLTPMASPPAAAQQVLIQFRLDAPQARNVTLAGNFTDWKPAYTLTRSEPGIWTVVVPLDPGVHDYAFVVDGQRWTPDPMAPAVDDGFGGLNSRVAVLSPDTRRPS
jgi:hypothetical protein